MVNKEMKLKGKKKKKRKAQTKWFISSDLFGRVEQT